MPVGRAGPGGGSGYFSHAWQLQSQLQPYVPSFSGLGCGGVDAPSAIGYVVLLALGVAGGVFFADWIEKQGILA
jgi:hypothetical protein